MIFIHLTYLVLVTNNGMELAGRQFTRRLER
jgi:hypothetical protein